MKILLKKTLVFLVLFLCVNIIAQAQQRRPVDSAHPLWLVHIDVWNKADPQKIIDLIPADVRPYVCMNLSLSCQYDTEADVYKMPQNAVLTYKSWASVCQANNMWFTCQPASGGHTHIKDTDLATFEYFFKHYPNFLGWNYAEQFWGFDEAGDKSSGTQAGRWELFANLVEMSHKYGGFLTVSFCGNIWSHPLNPNGIMSRNARLRENCQKYPEAFLLLYKYTTSSCFYNNESVCLAPFVSGLAKNYGVRYDNCGYNGALDELLGKSHGKKYPAAVGIGTVMEQTCVNGGAVWDGPELIWTEDFQNLGNTTVNGYSRRNWGTFRTFDNIWIDMFRKVIDGTMYIPTREEVIARNKVVIVNNQSGDDKVMFAAPDNLYDGLYKQSDPMNRGDGQWMDNLLFLKKTGRYQPVPVVLGLYDDLAKTIPVQVKRTEYASRWSSQDKKVEEFNALYPEVSKGDLFVSRFDNQLITYFNHSYLSSIRRETAEIPLQYNTCQTLQLDYGMFTSGVIREYADSITLYLNNYRTDTMTAVKNVITIVGAKAEPTFTIKRRANGTASTPVTTWDAKSGTFTLSTNIMGGIDLAIRCSGNATGRKTGARQPVALGLPKQPGDVLCPLIIEAEDMDYSGVKSCVLDPYGAYPSVRGHSGNGFIDMGSGSLRAFPKFKTGGEYTVAVRYSCTVSGGRLLCSTGGNDYRLALEKTGVNEWRKATFRTTFAQGEAVLDIKNSSAAAMYIDNVSFIPDGLPEEKYQVRLQASDHGTLASDLDYAYEGDIVTLTATPAPGYSFASWEVVHGDIKLSDAESPVATFTMPDDDVELKALFRDNTVVYSLDFTSVLSGTMPEGWRAVQGASEEHYYPNTYGSGARTFRGFSGYQGAALYWRENCAEYGRLASHPLTLSPGDYVATFACPAWKGAPTYYVQIEDPDGKAVAHTASLLAEPNANGSTSVGIGDSPLRTLPFTVVTAGDYVLRFVSATNGFTEFLTAHCQINKAPDPSGIDCVETERPASDAVYDIFGRRAAKPYRPGIYIRGGKKFVVR